MKTAVSSTFNATAGYGVDATGAVVVYFQPLNGTADTLSAANSPLYRTYCSLYEECKMIGCKIDLAIVSAVGGADIPSLQIYTAWDRKHGFGEAALSADDIKNASTYNVATALNNNVAKLTRSCYASDLIEKATWFDASLDSGNANRSHAWTAAGLNPNMFCPSFFTFLNCPSLGSTKSVSVSMSVTYYFSFRNPRFGGGGNAKLTDLGERVMSSMNNNDDDMDDGDGALLPDAPPDIDGAASASADEPARRSVLSKAPKQSRQARVVQMRREQRERHLADESLNA